LPATGLDFQPQTRTQPSGILRPVAAPTAPERSNPRDRAATRAGGSGGVTRRSSGHRRSAGWSVRRIAVATERPLGVPGGRAISLRLTDRCASTVALVTSPSANPFPRPCHSPPSGERRQAAVNFAGAGGRPAGSRPRRMDAVEIAPNGRYRIPRRNAFSVLDMARLNFVVHAVCDVSFTSRAMFPQPLFWIYGGRAAKRP
jgi:hypothetical protein